MMRVNHDLEANIAVIGIVLLCIIKLSGVITWPSALDTILMAIIYGLTVTRHGGRQK